MLNLKPDLISFQHELLSLKRAFWNWLYSVFSFFDEVEWKDSVQHVAESRLPSMMQDFRRCFEKTVTIWDL